MNKLGHGVSYSVFQEIYQKTEYANTDDAIFPENCSRGTFTILVEGNIDRLEETLSGKLLSLGKSIYIFYNVRFRCHTTVFATIKLCVSS